MSPAGAPLRVLMLCPQFRPQVGGYERAAERLALALARRGVHVEVLAERRSRTWPADEMLEGVRVRRVPVAFRRGAHTVSAVASVAAFLAAHRHDFDVLHAHQYGPQAGVALGLARALGWRTVLKLTSSGDAGIAARLGGRSVAARWLRERHRAVDACLIPTPDLADEAAAFGIAPRRVHWIPNGVDTEALAPAGAAERAGLRRRLGVGEGPLALFVGRLSPEKGPLLLAEAWTRVVPALPGAMLAYVGAGPEADALSEAVERTGTAASVRRVGAVDDPSPWYRAADTFVLPSRFEGLSNSLLEAMSCGLPVVSTRVPGSVDLFARADVGEMVPVGDASAIAAALLCLLSQPERRRACGAAARALAVRDFAVDRVAAAVETVYRGGAPARLRAA